MERKRLSDNKTKSKKLGKTSKISDLNGNVKGGKDTRTGRFVKGNKLGCGGNPYVAEQNRVRDAIRAQMPDDELIEFVKNWKRKAKAGKGVYMLSFLDRWLGKVVPFEVESRLQALEELAQQKAAGVVDGIKGPATELL